MFGWLTGGADEAPKQKQEDSPKPEEVKEPVKVVKEVEKPKEKEGEPAPSDDSSTAPVVVTKCLWPEGVEKPREGSWVVSDLNYKVRGKPQVRSLAEPSLNWQISDTRDDSLPALSYGEQHYIIKPITGDFSELTLPELFTPCWVAVGRNDVHWLQRVSPGRMMSLTQPLLMCNGSTIGKRQFLINEIVEEEEGKAVVTPDYGGKEYARAAINLHVDVTWKKKPEQDETAVKVNPALPKWAREITLSHSCYCWVVANGWISDSNTTTWLVLDDRALHHASAPNAAEYHEVPLKHVVIEPSQMIVGPNRMMQYPLVIKKKSGEVFFEATYFTETERDLWCAMIEITAAQIDLKKVIPEARLTVYERILTQALVPQPVPCIDPAVTPDNLSSCVASGYVIVQSQTGGWLAESWKRRWITVHDTFFTYRDSKVMEETNGFDVCRFHYTKILKAPQKEHPWVFVLYNPFVDPVHIWCDTKAAFAKWLAIFDNGVHRANPNVTYTEVGTVPQVGRPFLAQHGLVLPNGFPSLPFVAESSFRHLVPVDNVIGSEDGEVEVAADGALSWKGPDAAQLAWLTPKHHVVRGKKWNDPKPTPSTVTDCLLPESVIGTNAPVPTLSPTSCLLVTLPAATRITPRSQDTHMSVVVLSGVVKVTIFPGSCYTQISGVYPKIRSSTYDAALPRDWGSFACPVGYKGARTVEAPAGSYLYVPVDHYYAVEAPVEAVLLRCHYKVEK